MKKMIYTMIALLLMGALLAGCGKDATETQAPAISEETETIQPGPLTEEELLEFEKLFSATEDSDYYWYTMALTSRYSCPEDIDLFMLFYKGTGDEEIGPEEVAQLQEVVKEQKGEAEAQWWTEGQIVKMPKKKMDQLLKTYFGITLEQSNRVALDNMIYLEDTDSYYKRLHPMYVSNNIDFFRGHRFENGKIALYYWNAEGEEMEITLVDAPAGAQMPYYVCSHRPYTLANETFLPDQTAQSSVEFLGMLRNCNNRSERGASSVAYQDLTFVMDGVGLAYTYEIWYGAGSENLIRLGGGRCLDAEAYYFSVTYENSEAFVFVCLDLAQYDVYYNVHVFDTKGNILLDTKLWGAPTFDESSATLSFGAWQYEGDERLVERFYDEVQDRYNISLMESVDGEPRIAMTVDLGDCDHSMEDQAPTYSDETDNGEDSKDNTASKAEPGELTQKELQEFEQLFASNDWYDMARASWYDCPENVDLYMLFYVGFQGEKACLKEREMLQQIEQEQNGEKEARVWTFMRLAKNPKEMMDQVLRIFYGLSLEQTNGVGLDWMIYLPETDSYYKQIESLSRFNRVDFFRGYRTEDGKIVLHYWASDCEEMVVTLVEAPEGAEVPYYVYSHLPSDFTPPGAEGFVADKTARSAKEFFSMLRDSQGEGEGLFRSVAYRDLTYVRYGVDRAYTYQVWYQGKLIAGPRSLFSIYGDYCCGLANCYTVTYKNSETFVFFDDRGVPAEGHCFGILVFDTNGNVLVDSSCIGAPVFDEKTATLLDCNVSLKESVNGEPMIAVTADPGNSDLSHYNDDLYFYEDE